MPCRAADRIWNLGNDGETRGGTRTGQETGIYRYSESDDDKANLVLFSFFPSLGAFFHPLCYFLLLHFGLCCRIGTGGRASIVFIFFFFELNASLQFSHFQHQYLSVRIINNSVVFKLESEKIKVQAKMVESKFC